MTQMSVAPPSMPVVASPQAATAPRDGADAALGAVQGTAPDVAAGDAAGADFAAVLKAQIALPAKDAPATEIFAALPSSQATDTAEETPATEVLLPVAPDLATLLPALVGLASQMPSVAAPSPTADAAVQTASIALSQPVLASATGSNSDPASQKPAALVPDAGMARNQTAVASIADMEAAPPPANPFSQPQAAESPAGEEPAPSPQQASWLANLSAQPAPVEISSFAPNAGSQQMAGIAEQASPAIQATAAAPISHAPAATDAATVVRVDTPVGSHGWDAEIGQKVVLLVNQQESRAELTLTPPHLGKVEVSISINGDQTSASFISASPAAREALEQALPRLREILAEAGITLGQASVNAESARRDKDGPPTEGRAASHGEVAAGSAAAPAQWAHRRNGLIDTFA